MDVSMMMTGAERSKLEMQVDTINKGLQQGRGMDQELGKEDFLKILITQLEHQDPTSPLEDKQFIAQMAQFSSLEQMTNLSQDFAKITGMMNRGNALSLLGKEVELLVGDRRIVGQVEAISGTENPQIKVDGHYYDYGQVETVRSKEAAE
ncbi:MAG TPA: flagellar hook assembly protein FlgD [Sediminispirochaeta sp.]|nr:flagellar hook assembly protein FlgD [Sediminispirochaeta sp.]